jgi:hypothetical protein
VTSPSQSELIEFRFVGGDIVPHNVRASDLADLLEAAEALITSAVLREHHELTKDDIILGLTEVQSKSLGLRFTPSIPQIIIPEFERLADTIQRRLFDLLPHEAREALRKIATFTRKNRCVAQLRTGNREVILATVEPDLVIPAAPRLRIQTTIYGRVVNAGGKSPNAHLETLQGQMVICKGTQSQVKQLAERLYSFVGVIGTACCNVDTLDIDEFEIKDVLPYEDTPIVEAVRMLGEVAAPYFDSINADEYVRAIRGDDPED